MIKYLEEMEWEEAIKLPHPTFELWLEIHKDDPEPGPPRPSEWPLGSNEGRCGFLESYIWFGEEALFEAMSHIWNSMRKPKNTLCVYIGMYAGTGGSGKWALAKFLRRALRESLDYDGQAPWGQQYPTVDRYHEAAMDYFAADMAHYYRTIQKYADILNGESGRHAQHSAEVIKGPWRALPRIRLPDEGLLP